MTLGEAWERHAQDWIRWARTPKRDGFWTGIWPELQTLLPPAGGLVLEVGCGEGRVGRELLARGDVVVAVERSPTLARAARNGARPLTLMNADVAATPVASDAVDTVVACMSLQDIDDLDGATAEMFRVLRPGGRVCIAMVHPFSSAQEPSTLHSYEPVVSDSYLRERVYEDRMEREGIAMTHVSAHRPLQRYFGSFAAAGFVVRRLRELGAKPIPWLLCLELEKPRSG
jgi:SAM-dependent methyltransferase